MIWHEKAIELAASACLKQVLIAELAVTAYVASEVGINMPATGVVRDDDYRQASRWLGGVQVFGDLDGSAWLGGNEIVYPWLIDGLKVRADAVVQADHVDLEADARIRMLHTEELTADGVVWFRLGVRCDAIIVANGARLHPVPHPDRVRPVAPAARASRFDPRPD